ncbi:MAG TPA: HAMP domain-containing sensor histidine kinase [Ignavibacteriaceae bacterium]|nr:HAMP domain-containing sensor histidine kinase [Ignavibacteriaceae bacterium]
MKKIGLILLIIIILPIAFLLFNELGKLNENEQVLEQIYNNQLQAILFSVNQYSEDVVRTTANSIIDRVESTKDENFENRQLNLLINEGRKFSFLFVTDSLNSDEIRFYFRHNEIQANIDSVKNYFKNILLKSKALVNRLYTYREQGYRKIEPIVLPNSNDQSLLIFASGINNSKRIYGAVINPQEFITQILSSRLQEVAKDEFVISVVNPKTGYQYNSTKDFKSRPLQTQKALWIFPNYNLGISLIGQSIQDLVEERAMNNLILIGILLLVLAAAVWFVYRSVKKELEFAQAKADFVSNVSHELRTPLALISMFAETLEMDRVKTDEKKKEYYSIISHESNRLGRIVNSILNFSKMEAGKRKFVFAEEDLNEVIIQVYQNYSYHLYNKGFEFEYEPGIDIPKITIDREAVSEAIVNLIDNAVKYSTDTKFIKMIIGNENEYVFIEIQDKGIGISEEDQKKVFDKFYRVSSGLVHTSKGTGLGLSLVKQIMDAHEGKIILKSKVGEGSSFKLLFPKISQLKLEK